MTQCCLRQIIQLLAAGAVLNVVAFFACDWLATGAAGAFSLPAYSTPAGLPLLLLALSFVWFLLTPSSAWLSRRFEFEADRYAIQLTGRSDSFVTAMGRFVETNLATNRQKSEQILTF